MRIADRYDLARDLGGRYLSATKVERGEILDAFCLTTGYHRKYASGVLLGRQRRQPAQPRRPRRRRYGPEFLGALAVLWEASAYVCAERLQPWIPELLPLLEQHRQLVVDDHTRTLLLAASVSTVERRLQQLRKTRIRQRLSQTKPGTLLRRQIPVIVGRWKEVDRPGFVEIDLVSHSGEVAVGRFHYTVSVVDLCTGWTERMAIWGKNQEVVVAALDQVRDQLPFPLLGIHPDNGSEFINRNLYGWCQANAVAFSRGRPYRKNDNAHVEQKNWTLIRRLIGYERLDTPEQLTWLNAFYGDLLRPFANCFQACMKQIGRDTSSTGRTRRLYDRPRTPMRRLLESGHADLNKLADLTRLYTEVSPLTLKRRIDRALAAMPLTLRRTVVA
jgi:transposase InsO family protein